MDNDEIQAAFEEIEMLPAGSDEMPESASMDSDGNMRDEFERLLGY